MSEAAPTGELPRVDEHPLREVLRIAGPTVATMTSYTFMTFTDKYLVAHLGSEPVYVGAQGNGGLASWVPISVAQGTLTILNTFVSQNMGAGQARRGPAYIWNGLWIALSFWLIFLVPYSFALPAVLRASGIDSVQAELGGEYGQILTFGAILTLATRVFSQFFYGMHKPMVTMVAGITANIVNVFVSAVLAFGTGPVPDFGSSVLGAIMQPVAEAAHGCAVLLDIPRLSVAGSAWGTLIASLVELAIPMLVFLSPKMNTLYGTRGAWRYSKSIVKDIIKLGWPGGVMFGSEMVCWAFFMVYLVSKFGKEHATAGWIAHQYMSLSFMPAVGLSVACTALVGKYQGMRRSDVAASRAWLCVKFAFVYMGVCGLAFVMFRKPMVNLFVPDETDAGVRAALVRMGGQFLIATACFQLFDAIAMVLGGALRGAGDTRVPGIITIVLSWTIIVGGGLAIVTYVPTLESLGAWIAAATYIAALAAFMFGRFVRGKWKTIKVVKGE